MCIRDRDKGDEKADDNGGEEPHHPVRQVEEAADVLQQKEEQNAIGDGPDPPLEVEVLCRFQKITSL